MSSDLKGFTKYLGGRAIEERNTLVSGNEHKWVREVNPGGQTPREFNSSDLPEGSGFNLGNSSSIQLLDEPGAMEDVELQR